MAVARYTAMDTAFRVHRIFEARRRSPIRSWFKTVFESSYISCICSILLNVWCLTHTICIVNIPFFHPSASLLSTHIACFVYVLHDSDVTNPLSHYHVHSVNPACVSQATCLSPWFHLISLFLLLPWANRMIWSNTERAHWSPAALSWWHAASHLQSSRAIEKLCRLNRGPQSPKGGPLLCTSEPWLTNYRFPTGFHRENRRFLKLLYWSPLKN